MGAKVMKNLYEYIRTVTFWSGQEVRIRLIHIPTGTFVEGTTATSPRKLGNLLYIKLSQKLTGVWKPHEDQ